MKELLRAIYTQINSVHGYKTYNALAPEQSAFPYVTYKLTPVSPTEQDRDDYMLEISCWDKSSSTSHNRVLDITEAVRQSLVGFRYLDEYNLIIATRPSAGYIPDPDAMIKRYDVTSTLKTYRR